MTFYLTLWHCIWKICFVWAWHAVSSWMFDVELCELFTWNHFEGTVGLGDLQFQFVRAGTSWLCLMLTSGETCIWKFGKQTVLVEMNWTLFEMFCFVCFVFCFPSNVLGVLLWEVQCRSSRLLHRHFGSSSGWNLWFYRVGNFCRCMPGVRARGRAAIELRGPSSAARSSGSTVVLHFPAIAVSFGVFLSGIFVGICIVLIWIFAGV